MRQRGRNLLQVLFSTFFVLTSLALATPGRAQTVGAEIPTTLDGFDKPNQHRLFYHDGNWWLAARADDKDWYLWKLDGVTWTKTILISAESNARPDCIVDTANNKLYIYISDTSDSQFLRLTYNAGNWSIDNGYPTTIAGFPHIKSPGPGSMAREHAGGFWIFRIANATLEAKYSSNEGISWSETIAVKSNLSDADGLTSAVKFKIGNDYQIGVAYGENTNPLAQFGFLRHQDGTATSTWVDETNAMGQFAGTEADDHIAAVADTSGRVYIVTKTDGGGSTTASNGFYMRDAFGWTKQTLNTDDGWTRPAVSYDQQNDEIYAFGTIEGSSGIAEYKKVSRSATSGFLNAGRTIVLQNGTDGFVDISVPAHPVDHTTNLMVAAENKFRETIWVNEVNIIRVNNAPTAVASADFTSGKTPLTVNFTGSNSFDIDGTIATYNWNFGDGGADSGDANPVRTFTTAGTYSVRLIVTDNEGKKDTTFLEIRVVDPIAPVAVIGTSTSSGKAPLQVQFTGSNSTDEDGTVKGYLWDFGDATGTNTSTNPLHTYVTPGNFTATLIVTDDDGLKDTTTTAITVVAPLPPTAVASVSPTSGNTFVTFQFQGDQSTDSDGSIVSYAWDFGDGAGSSTEVNPSYKYNSSGTFNVELIVLDVDGLRDTTNISLPVTTPVAPTAVASATPLSASTLTTVQFTGSGSSDSDGSITSYAWDFGDNNGASTTADPSYRYTSPGTYVATLTVTDNDGQTGTASVSIVVEQAKKPLAVATATPDSGDAPLTVSFKGSGSLDDDGTVIGYTWDFGDDVGTSQAPDPSYTFNTGGQYIATLIVEDNDGLRDTASVTIKVFQNFPPTVAITLPAADTTITRMDSFAFAGTATDSEDGDLPASHFIWSVIKDGSGPTVIATNTKADDWLFSTVGGYWLELKVHDKNGEFSADSVRIQVDHVTAIGEEQDTAPVAFELSELYPNPIARTEFLSGRGVNLRFRLAEPDQITIRVFNTLGQQVASLQEQQRFAAGEHVISWHGSVARNAFVSGGLYFIRVQAGQRIFTRKFVLIR